MFVAIFCFMAIFCSSLFFVSCGDGKEYDLEVLECDHGHVEIFTTNDPNKGYFLKPIADDGYYFLKWEISDKLFGTSYEYSSICSQPKWLYHKHSIKAIFTDNKDDVYFYDFHIEVENGLHVNVEYLPYVNAENPKYSFYVHENKDVVLKKAYYYCDEPSGNYAGNIISLFNEEIYPSKTLPYSSHGDVGEGWTMSFMVLEFKDVRNL